MSTLNIGGIENTPPRNPSNDLGIPRIKTPSLTGKDVKTTKIGRKTVGTKGSANDRTQVSSETSRLKPSKFHKKSTHIPRMAESSTAARVDDAAPLPKRVRTTRTRQQRIQLTHEKDIDALEKLKRSTRRKINPDSKTKGNTYYEKECIEIDKAIGELRAELEKTLAMCRETLPKAIIDSDNKYVKEFRNQISRLPFEFSPKSYMPETMDQIRISIMHALSEIGEDIEYNLVHSLERIPPLDGIKSIILERPDQSRAEPSKSLPPEFSTTPPPSSSGAISELSGKTSISERWDSLVGDAIRNSKDPIVKEYRNFFYDLEVNVEIDYNPETEEEMKSAIDQEIKLISKYITRNIENSIPYDDGISSFGIRRPRR